MGYNNEQPTGKIINGQPVELSRKARRYALMLSSRNATIFSIVGILLLAVGVFQLINVVAVHSANDYIATQVLQGLPTQPAFGLLLFVIILLALGVYFSIIGLSGIIAKGSAMGFKYFNKVGLVTASLVFVFGLFYAISIIGDKGHLIT